MEVDALLNGYEGQARKIRLEYMRNALIDLNNIELASYCQQQIQLFLLSSTDIVSLNEELVDQKVIADRKAIVDAEDLRLSNELQVYLDNKIKESIRMELNILFDHHFNTGRLKEAFDDAKNAKPYCVSPNQLLENMFLTVKAALPLKDYNTLNHCYSQSSLITKSKTEISKTDLHYALIIQAAGAVAKMAQRKYIESAKMFKACIDSEPDILQSQHIAIYGSLCCLAVFDRQTIVECQRDFKNCLEDEPEAKEWFKLYLNSDFRILLDRINSYKGIFYCDIYLAEVHEELISKIREQCLILFCSQFSRITIQKITQLFPSQVDAKTELLKLILDGKLSSKIDEENQILLLNTFDPKKEAFKNIELIESKFSQIQEAHTKTCLESKIFGGYDDVGRRMNKRGYFFYE